MMKSLFEKWRALPLAVKILICMVLGIVLGLILHQQDGPLEADDPRILRRALLKVDGFDEGLLDRIAGEDGRIAEPEWTAWLEAERAARVDANGDGVLDRTELKRWDEDNKLSHPELDRAAEVYSQVIEGQRATAATDPARQLTRRGLSAWLGAIPTEHTEVIGAVRTTLDEVKGAQGKPLASVLAIFGDLFLGLIRSIVVPLVFIAVFVGIAGNDDVATVKKVGFGILVYFLYAHAGGRDPGKQFGGADQAGRRNAGWISGEGDGGRAGSGHRGRGARIPRQCATDDSGQPLRIALRRGHAGHCALCRSVWCDHFGAS